MGETVCPRCGRALPADAPGGLCASCLLVASAETMASGSIDSMPTMLSGSTDNMATMSSAVGSAVPVAAAPALEPGTEWGPYRIGRLLGRGGMGEVYEADHLQSGRRVALKVLRNRLQTPDERGRFLREGQLAASLSHPHTVYIFGSEEISGTPVISMELLTGGTLKDRVTANGPMSVDDAVAAVIDLIGGLDAAAAAGILHRDIKPSNCFIDRDGVVKVGDFGLSISTLARDVHQQLLTSGFEGTPQFAPPEQLRGEPLDVRADIYAVGATLYYLLTGRPPFDAPDLGTLFKVVTTEAPVSPRQLRRDIPARLSAVVMQCLAKTPPARPASYPALADALRPFLARHDKPAPFVTRTLAGVLDAWIIVGLPAGFVTAMYADPLGGSPESTLTLTNWAWVATFVYYLLLEGAFAASLCKRLLGLRVVSADGTSASWSQIAIRTTVFYLPSLLLSIALLGFVSDYSRTAHGSGFSVDVPRTATAALSLVMFFATARRRNGWTGLHDVLSRTRVVARPAVTERLARTAQEVRAAAELGPSARRYGPFVAMDQSEPRPGDVVRAFDPALRRQVWIEIQEPSAAPIGNARRDLARPGRLHWLTGRRSADESWDAYEAPDGRAWTDTVTNSRWTQTNQELIDLVNELASASADGTQPPLALDRIWRRENGRIVLLDFAPPSSPRGRADLTPPQLLQAAASRVPRASSESGRLPLSALMFLEQWSGPLPLLPALAEARDALQTMAAAPTHVHWWRRAIPGTLAAAPVLLMLVVTATIVPTLARFFTSDTATMMSLLGALKSTTLPADNPMRQPEVRSAAEVTIAGRYGHLIRDDAFWKAGVVRSLAPDYRVQAEDILKRHPHVSAAELAAAEAVMKKSREDQEQKRSRPPERDILEMSGVIMSTVTALALALVLILCVISSLLVPGGLVSRNLGLAAVTSTGREISRARSVARVVVAGLPGIAWFVYLTLSPRVQGWVPTPPRPIMATLVTVSVLAIGLVWTVVRRTRGPHDILTGTWVVPR